MTTEALRMATDVGRVDRALGGHHREWYVVRPTVLFSDTVRLKVGAPRDVPWFDRRCFASEEALLTELAARGFPYVPRVHPSGRGPLLHGFVEGRTLDELAPAGSRVPYSALAQIMAVFRRLAGVRPQDFPVPRLCGARDRAADGDSAGFLRSLLRFTRERAYLRHLPRYGRLFRRLGLTGRALGARSPLAAEADRLTARPFCLLHGDLHRANFIVHPSGTLWTVDWELALLGDPLYDLATHLHLTRYPADQEHEVIRTWRSLMSTALPGATSGMAEDLPRYRAYKRAQSVYTDVVRHAWAVGEAGGREQRKERLRTAGEAVHGVLADAAPALCLRNVPSPAEVEDAYRTFGAVRDVRTRG